MLTGDEYSLVNQYVCLRRESGSGRNGFTVDHVVFGEGL